MSEKCEISLNGQSYKLIEHPEEICEILEELQTKYGLVIEYKPDITHRPLKVTDYVVILFKDNPFFIKRLEMREYYDPEIDDEEETEAHLDELETSSEETEEETDYDFYSVQYFVDGFGNDNRTAACFRTRAEAEDFLAERRKWYLSSEDRAERWNEEEWAIVPQKWGGYDNYDF